MIYSSRIFYNCPNQFDRISVGLIWTDDNMKSIVKISEEKMEIVKKINKTSYDLFELYVKNFESSFYYAIIDLDIIERYQKNSNGIVQFTESTKIFVDFTEENFNKYFERYV